MDALPAVSAFSDLLAGVGRPALLSLHVRAKERIKETKNENERENNEDEK